MDARVALSIVVPVLNEAESVAAFLSTLAPLRAESAEVIVVDGGSDDGTLERAHGLCDQLLSAPRGRARQMNAGARAARGTRLVFLHADTRLPPQAGHLICEALEGHAWGRFDVTIEGAHPLLALIAWAMNARSRLTGIATGDQAIFVRREAFDGFPDLPLMEDIAFSRSMKRKGWPACLRTKVSTSGRRWESRGVLGTMLLMWRLRLAYALGADPARLAERYR
jgi:rSAM/selenodomain-associated transferase 2